MVWYRICGSIAWVGASLDVGLDGFLSSFDVSKRGSCAVPWFASYGFSGLLGKGLWSLCSIATVLEQSIANRVCVSSLVARVDGLFSGGFSCLKK
ncbi:hypothetical protein HID58_020428, partial [Brassica napus]